jgi:membrane-associated protein
VFAKRREDLEKAQDALRRHGGKAVFLARFTAFLRAVMPGLAGTARMPYRRFLAFNAAGGLIWAVGFTILGYLAGASYHQIEKVAGPAGEVILILIVLAVLVFVIRRAAANATPDRPHSVSPDLGPHPPGVPKRKQYS